MSNDEPVVEVAGALRWEYIAQYAMLEFQVAPAYVANVGGFKLLFGINPKTGLYDGLVMSTFDGRMGFRRPINGIADTNTICTLLITEMVRMMSKMAGEAIRFLIPHQEHPDTKLLKLQAGDTMNDTELAAREKLAQIKSEERIVPPAEKKYKLGEHCGYCGLPFFSHPEVSPGKFSICNKGILACE